MASDKKIFKISANESTLWTLAAMLNFKSAPKTNLVEDHPMNISGQFGSNLFSGFREEDLAKRFQRRFLEIDQSEARIACGGHVY